MDEDRRKEIERRMAEDMKRLPADQWDARFTSYLVRELLVAGAALAFTDSKPGAARKLHVRMKTGASLVFTMPTLHPISAPTIIYMFLREVHTALRDEEWERPEGNAVAARRAQYPTRLTQEADNA